MPKRKANSTVDLDEDENTAKNKRTKGENKSGKTDMMAAPKTSKPGLIQDLNKNAKITKVFGAGSFGMFKNIFLWSLPRDKETRISYQNKMKKTTDILKSLIFKTVVNIDLPVEMANSAKEKIDKLKKIQRQLEGGLFPHWTGDPSPDYLLNDDMVFHHVHTVRPNEDKADPLDDMWNDKIGHKILLVQVNDIRSLEAYWEGQFFARVNPAINRLRIHLLNFTPKFTEATFKDFQENKFTDAMEREILKQTQNFEMARQLKIDIPLPTVFRIYIETSPDNTVQEAVMILEVSALPIFYQRYINTSADLSNQFKKRSCFLVDQKPEVPLRIYIGGSLSVLQKLAAEMIESEPRMKDIYALGKSEALPAGFCVDKNSKVHEFKPADYIVDIEDTEPVPLTDEARKLRLEIIDLLLKYGVIKKRHAETNRDKLKSARKKTRLPNRVDNHLGGLNVHHCLFDYVNFFCRDVAWLEKLLCKRLHATQYGYEVEDLMLKKIPEHTVDEDVDDNEDKENTGAEEEGQSKAKEKKKKKKKKADEPGVLQNTRDSQSLTVDGEMKDGEKNKVEEKDGNIAKKSDSHICDEDKNDEAAEKRNENGGELKENNKEDCDKGDVEENDDKKEKNASSDDDDSESSSDDDDDDESSSDEEPVTEFDYKTYNMDKMRVFRFLQLNRNKELFYSFCNGVIHSEPHNYHCERCHECVDDHYYHCGVCDRCDFGHGSKHCSHCGAQKVYGSGWMIVGTKIIPHSIYEKNSFGCMEGNPKEESKWKLEGSKDDRVFWSNPLYDYEYCRLSS